MPTMLEFQYPKITQEDVTDTHGTFTVEPLDRGFGYDVRKLAAPRPAIVHRGGRGHLGEDRGHRARVHVHPRRPRGRHRHHPQPQGPRRRAARRVGRGRGPDRQGRPRRRHGRRHRRVDRARDAEPRARDLPPGRGRALRDDPDDRPRSRLRGGRWQQGSRDDDRRHPGGLDLLARPPRRRARRLGARRPAHGLRQAHARRRDGRLDQSARRGRSRPPSCSSSSSRSSPTSTPTTSRASCPAAAPSRRRRRRTGWRTS